GRRRRLGGVGDLALAQSPFRPHRPRFPGRLRGDAVEPVADLLPRHDRGRAAGEDEEGGLEGVLGVVVVAEDPAADAPDHRPVALHQGLEGGLLATRDEAFQELAVGEPDERPRLEEGAEVPEAWVHAAGHRCVAPPAGLDRPLPIITRRREGSYTFSVDCRFPRLLTSKYSGEFNTGGGTEKAGDYGRGDGRSRAGSR